MLQVLGGVFYFVFRQLEEIKRLQIGTSVENEHEPEIVSVAIKNDFFDVCVDWKIQEVGIDGESWIVSEHIDRHFLHHRAQLTPSLENRLQVFAVDNQMLITVKQLALLQILFWCAAHNKLLHALKWFTDWSHIGRGENVLSMMSRCCWCSHDSSCYYLICYQFRILFYSKAIFLVVKTLIAQIINLKTREMKKSNEDVRGASSEC